MLPTSHPVPISSGPDSAPLGPATLADAFVEFSTAAGRLESSYRELRKEVTHLRAALAERSRSLRTSQAENLTTKLALRQIVDSLPCGVLVLEDDNRVELINPEAKRLLSTRDQNVVYLDDIPEPCQTPLRAARARITAESTEDEFCVNGPADSRWLAVRVRPLPSDRHSGSPAESDGAEGRRRTVLILRDTTNHKRLEEEREAARNVVALAEMSAVLAHEIRNPLGSLELLAGLIAQQSPDAKEYTSHLCAGIRSLSATVNSVLLFHGGCAIQRSSTDLGETLRSTVEFLRPVATQHGIELTLKEQLGSAEVWGDDDALRQVFLNLALNAFHHTAAGGFLKILARTCESSRKARVLIEFCDNGCGIDPQALPRIFEAGFSASGQRPGLGLTVCRRIVEQHNGVLSVSSEVGRGTTFCMEIPCA